MSTSTEPCPMVLIERAPEELAVSASSVDDSRVWASRVLARTAALEVDVRRRSRRRSFDPRWCRGHGRDRRRTPARDRRKPAWLDVVDRRSGRSAPTLAARDHRSRRQCRARRHRGSPGRGAVVARQDRDGCRPQFRVARSGHGDDRQLRARHALGRDHRRPRARRRPVRARRRWLPGHRTRRRNRVGQGRRP